MGNPAEVNADKGKHPPPEQENHRQDGTELDNHFKRFCFIAGKADKLSNNNHMTG